MRMLYYALRYPTGELAGGGWGHLFKAEHIHEAALFNTPKEVYEFNEIWNSHLEPIEIELRIKTIA